MSSRTFSPPVCADWAPIFFLTMSPGDAFPSFPMMLHCYPYYKGWKAGEAPSSCSHITLMLDINQNQSALHAILASLSGFELLGEISPDTTWWLTDGPADSCLSGRPEFEWIMECSCNCVLTEESLGNPSACSVGYLHFNSKCQALTSSPSGSSSCALLLSHLQCIVTWLLVCLLAFRTFTATAICMRATDSRTSLVFHKELPPSLVYQDPHPFPAVLEVPNLHFVPYDLPVLDISCTWGHTVWDLWDWLHLASLPGLCSWEHE